MTPWRSSPDGVTGEAAFVPPSMSTPIRLYSSMRVLAIVSVRGPAPVGAICAVVTCATPYPRNEER